VVDAGASGSVGHYRLIKDRAPGAANCRGAIHKTSLISRDVAVKFPLGLVFVLVLPLQRRAIPGQIAKIVAAPSLRCSHAPKAPTSPQSLPAFLGSSFGIARGFDRALNPRADVFRTCGGAFGFGVLAIRHDRAPVSPAGREHNRSLSHRRLGIGSRPVMPGTVRHWGESPSRLLKRGFHLKRDHWLTEKGPLAN
jgi:hypothetical protein